ncbi:MAG: calcium-binding protein, partial [Hydrococcus sp. Prado102]|nr:calcium-binding protein [Hydrococcus sp. Prado102]
VSDTLVVSARGFGGGLRAGAILPLAQFRLGARALDASDRFIYNSNTGALLFDVDGIGAIAPVALATLDPRLALTRADIFVTA